MELTRFPLFSVVSRPDNLQEALTLVLRSLGRPFPISLEDVEPQQRASRDQASPPRAWLAALATRDAVLFECCRRRVCKTLRRRVEIYRAHDTIHLLQVLESVEDYITSDEQAAILWVLIERNLWGTPQTQRSAPSNQGRMSPSVGATRADHATKH